MAFWGRPSPLPLPRRSPYHATLLHSKRPGLRRARRLTHTLALDKSFTQDAPVADESPAWIHQEERIDHQLVRGIGIPALTANIVSSTIGAGIFVIPATVAKGLGSAAPLAFVCCAIAMVLFVTCFAIAGSRVSLTGGLYASVVLINIRGVRQGAGAVTVITVAKLLPLLLFVCVGIFFIHAPNLSWNG